MKKYLILIFIICIQCNVYSQSSQNSARLNLMQLEEKILEENTDLEAIRLIKVNNEKLKALNDFRLNAVNAFGADLTQQEKNSKFRKEFINSEELRELKDEEKIAKDIKIAYLKSAYPGVALQSKDRSKLKKGVPARFKKKG